MADIHSGPVVLSEILVLLEYPNHDGTKVYLAMTDSDAGDVAFGVHTFRHVNGLSVVFGESNGTTTSPPSEVRIPTAALAAFLPTYAGATFESTPLPALRATVWKTTRSTSGEVKRTIEARGEVSEILKNPSGQLGMSQFSVASLKNDARGSVSFTADIQCDLEWGGPVCGIDLKSKVATGTMTAATRGVVTITGLPAAQHQLYWHRGFVERNGVRIFVQEWKSAQPTRFVLVQRPPSEWVGKTVRVAPGCDRLPTTCKLWNNENRFLGLGIAMPPYNPILESAG